jgi:6-phosphogluconolactonase (cycloisomerase 2 family)
VSTFAVGAAGDLTAAFDLPLGANACPVDAIVAPGGVVFVADAIAETIAPLAFDATTGSLVPLGAAVASPGVQALALDAKGRLLVAMSSASPGSISAFTVSAGGSLAAVGAPLATGPHAAMDIELGPDGETFYIVTAASTLLTVVADAQGNLHATRTTPTPAASFPCALAVDASGEFFYFADFADDEVSVLAAGAGGSLSPGPNVPVKPSHTGSTTEPYWVVTAP